MHALPIHVCVMVSYMYSNWHVLLNVDYSISNSYSPTLLQIKMV